MKVHIMSYFSLVSHTHSTEQLNRSTSMMITDSEYSLKKEWVKKLKLIPSVRNLKVMSSESTVDSIRTDSQWNKESFVITELDFYSHPVPLDIEPREKDREKEDQLEDVSSAPISRCFLWLLSKREKRIFPDSLTSSRAEDWAPKEPAALENYMVLKRPKDKRPLKHQVLW